MKVYTKGGDLPFKAFLFPDGQPHFELLHRDEWPDVTIEMPITSCYDLMMLLLAKDALTAAGYIVSADIRYLMGARMDRRISDRHPATLEVLGRMLLAAGFRRLRVLDPHSDRTARLCDAVPVLPLDVMRLVLGTLTASGIVVAPDAGARPRIERLLAALQLAHVHRIAQARKKRDPQSGTLSGFGLDDASAVAGKECLIVDDLCDGGGTFIGLAEVLAAAGAKSVDLYVTHGVFSKGTRLKGIRRIYTTDSYQSWPAGVDDSFTCFPVEMRRMQDGGAACL